MHSLRHLRAGPVRAGGSRTFIVQYKFGEQHRRLTLGAVGSLDLGKAKATGLECVAGNYTPATKKCPADSKECPMSH